MNTTKINNIFSHTNPDTIEKGTDAILGAKWKKRRQAWWSAVEYLSYNINISYALWVLAYGWTEIEQVVAGFFL